MKHQENMDDKTTNLTEVERIKQQSNFLRGTINESLIDEITGALASDDTQLIKFHGSYQQSDRDLESERKKQKLEPLYSFMIRVRLPGGIATPKQWLTMDELADEYGNGTLKLTTRQTFQLHGVFKRNLKTTIRKINDALLDSIAACGDVNRNVLVTSDPEQSALHSQVLEDARSLSHHLLPKTYAYHEIWLDKKRVAGGEPEDEPIYGKTYLPRKFKIAFAIPPDNDTDLFTNDLGFIALADERQNLMGYNVSVGGGMGMTFGTEGTYPRLADVIGFIPRSELLIVAENIVKIQRDLGDRSDRKKARLKYTIDRMGLETFKKELNSRLDIRLQNEQPYSFTTTGDHYGWKKGSGNSWSLTLFIEGGRIIDRNGLRLKTALKQIAMLHTGEFRLTANQNLIISGISPKAKQQTERILKEHQVNLPGQFSGLRLNSIACVALNTCPLAFAEAERYLPGLIDKLDVVMNNAGLSKEEITIRMTGCPNGCGRPYNAEIGFVGRSPGHYNLYLGGSYIGNRLNILYKEMLNEQQILETLTPILTSFSNERQPGEHFGDFVRRQGLVG
jgi:sulfite reductase (NADPH) hemoprotein beta-component